ncbi:uncharacterized protein Tco025E_00369 [Trypanosoma conorhini]|uniref:Uncharacterized protein n=1 Tax=Trypanosoma conorhini TaxID=83891 RepID=A0A3R7P1J0_9TRYP|nr:uncharacterized protein Tco025E_00369 [Trypanosoma conorhini]RNF27371.1 hypothetical protein Tco025E_00369 [Trypanosoma conorhini]
MEQAPSATTITAEAIKKICVQLGYYRNPVCNEKLYLHHKGFDSIEEDAFDAYTDVKVLWLEGNALTRLQCGKDSLPRRKPQPQAEGSAPEPAPAPPAPPEVGCSKSAQRERCANTHVDHCADWTTAPPPHIGAVAEALQASVATDAATAPSPVVSATASGESKDVFQSLYPTLRQLFLHNNALREMPDLSGFQRLDTVNLANNCIHSVQANCAAFSARVAEFEAALRERAQALVANSKSMQNELRARDARLQQTAARDPQPGCDAEEQTGHEAARRDFVALPAPTEATATATEYKRNEVAVVEGGGGAVRLDMDVWRRRLSAYVDFCPHAPLEVAENGKLSDDVPPGCRNPCSSIRSLNLAANYLAEVDDIVQLLCFKNLAVLDLSNNQLENGEAVLLIMERLPRLRSLRLSGNPLVRSLPRYRKMVLARCPGLLHLDDRPVFADERRLVMAWVRGGDEAEQKERLLMRKETEKQHIRRLEEFREMVGRFLPTGPVDPHGASEAAPRFDPQRRAPQGGGAYLPARPRDDDNNNDDDDVTSSESDGVEGEESRRRTRAARPATGSNNNVQNAIITPAPEPAGIAQAPVNTRDPRTPPSSGSGPQAAGPPPRGLRLGGGDDEEGNIYIPPAAAR